MDRKKVTALLSLDQFEKKIIVQVQIDLVYHLSYHNKLPTTFSFELDVAILFQFKKILKKGWEKRIKPSEK